MEVMRTLFAIAFLPLLTACSGTNLQVADLCYEPMTVCGVACVDLQSNAANCGVCGNACAAGMICHAGNCILACSGANEVVCGEACVNIMTDNRNCGACGNACGDGEVCSQGICGTTCAQPLFLCDVGAGAYCADLWHDPANCKECGNACAAGLICLDGECTGICDGVGRELCSGTCTDVRWDPDHCGACDVACPVGVPCQDGFCQPVCSTMCDKTCVNLQVDDVNCGRCGHVCDVGLNCSGGICKSPSCGKTYFGMQALLKMPPSSGPRGVAQADFNGDQRMDMVVVDAGLSVVYVFLANDHGGFDVQSYGVAGGPAYVTIADFDKVNGPDIAVLTSGLGMTLLFNDGSGAFGGRQDITVGGGGGYGIASGDVNNDGCPDLAFARGDLAVMLNDCGDSPGTFGAITPYSMPAGSDSVTLADVNGDGYLDLIGSSMLGSCQGGIEIHLNDGSGNFTGPQQWIAGRNSSYWQYHTLCDADGVQAADFDGDGKMDLIATNWAWPSAVALVMNQGFNGCPTCMPTFTEMNYWVGQNPYFLTLADFDKDSHPDVAVANAGSNYVTVLITKPTYPGAELGSRVDYVVGSAPYMIASGNFNDLLNDASAAHWPDVIVVDTEGGDRSVRILPNLGKAKFPVVTQQSLTVAGSFATSGDLNGDGWLDLLTLNADNTFAVWLNNGVGGISTSGPITQNLPVGAKFALMQDVNGDGHADVAVCGNGQDGDWAKVFWGEGTGSFTASVSLVPGSGAASLAIGDVNSDGLPDLIVANTSGNNVSVFLQLAGNSFASAANYSVATAPVGVALGDFDHDGKLDIATANHDATNGVSVLLNQGSGVFPNAPTNYLVGGMPSSLVAADFNNDGKADLAVAKSDSDTVGTVAVLLAQNGGFAQPVIYPVGVSPSQLASADLNNDGILDLAVPSVGNGSFYLLLGAANGTFKATVPFAAGAQPASLALADFDRDGRVDLVFANGTTTASLVVNRCAP